MAMNVSKIKQESNFVAQEPIDAGALPARVVQLITLGLQPQKPYKGDPKPPVEELYITYEMADEFMKDEEGNEIEDKPRWLSETITLRSLDSDLAKSTKRYYALDPKVEHGGDFSKLAGAPCVLAVIQNPSKKAGDDRIFNNIEGVTAMREKDIAKAPELVNPPKVFDIDEPDMEVFTSLPEWLQNKIKENLNYGGSALEKAVKNLGENVKGEAKAEPEAGSDEDEADW